MAPVYVEAAVYSEAYADAAERLADRAAEEGAESAEVWLRAFATQIRNSAARDRREVGEAPTPRVPPPTAALLGHDPTEPG